MNVAPRVGTGVLGDALEEQRQHAERHMGMDTVHRPVIDGAQAQPALERAPRLLDALELLVTERQVLGAQGVVVAVDHELALEALGRLDLGRIDAELAGLAQAQVAPITTAGTQRTHPLAVTRGTALAQAFDLGREFFEHPDPMAPLASRLLGVEAHRVASPALPVADDHFLDLQVLGDLVKASRTAHDVLADLTAAVNGHANNVAPPTSSKLGEVVLRDHAGIADEYAPVESPTLELALDTLDRGHIHGVAGKDPVADREAVSGNRQSDDDLGRIAAPVLRVTALARCCIALGAGGRTPTHLPITVPFVFFVDLEVQRGGVVEDEFDVEVEPIGRAEVDRLLERILVRFEEVHGPIQVLESEPLGALDTHLLGQPLLVAVELRDGCANPVGHHREQGPLDREPELAPSHHLGDRLGNPESTPQRLQHVDLAVGPGIDEPPARILGDDVLGRTTAQDTVCKSAKAFGDGGIIGPPEAVHDLYPRALLVRIPDVLGELEVLEGGTVGTFLSRGAQVHVSDNTTSHRSMQYYPAIPCIYVLGRQIPDVPR